MLHRAFFLFTIFFSLCTYAQGSDTTDYSKYQTGEFYVITGSDTCFITRTEDRQKESCSGSDEVYELIVIWLKDNKYILRDIHYNPSTNPRVMRKDVVMTIMETAPDYYMVHVRQQGQKKQMLKVYCAN